MTKETKNKEHVKEKLEKIVIPESNIPDSISYRLSPKLKITEIKAVPFGNSEAIHAWVYYSGDPKIKADYDNFMQNSQALINNTMQKITAHIAETHVYVRNFYHNFTTFLLPETPIRDRQEMDNWMQNNFREITNSISKSRYALMPVSVIDRGIVVAPGIHFPQAFVSMRHNLPFSNYSWDANTLLAFTLLPSVKYYEGLVMKTHGKYPLINGYDLLNNIDKFHLN